MALFDQDPTEFFCSHDDSSFQPGLRGKSGEEPWVQLCVTGDDALDLNLNMSMENAKRLHESLQEFFNGIANRS